MEQITVDVILNHAKVATVRLAAIHEGHVQQANDHPDAQRYRDEDEDANTARNE